MSFIQIEKPLQECTMIYGIRGCGKTKLLQYLLNQYDIKNIPFLLFDTMHNHNWQPKHKQSKIIKPPYRLKHAYFIKTLNYAWKKGNIIVAIEEIDQYCSPRFLPEELDSIVNLGRNRGISYIATTRRIADVHKDVIANCEHHFIFKAFLPRDLEEYQKYVGKVVWKAKDLPSYHFIYYRVGGEPTICKPIPIK